MQQRVSLAETFSQIDPLLLFAYKYISDYLLTYSLVFTCLLAFVKASVIIEEQEQENKDKE